jgi:hypothetical protein
VPTYTAFDVVPQTGTLGKSPFVLLVREDSTGLDETKVPAKARESAARVK